MTTKVKPTVEKWESRYNKYMADCWDDHIRTFPQADTREWNSGFDMAQGLAEDFIHSIIKKSVQEAKAEEAKRQEKLSDQIMRQSDYYEGVADKFLYACGGFDKFGEHTSMNDPYQNAIDWIASLKQEEEK